MTVYRSGHILLDKFQRSGKTLSTPGFPSAVQDNNAIAHANYSLTWYPPVKVYITNWKITMLLMGKSTISMAIFDSYFDITRG